MCELLNFEKITIKLNKGEKMLEFIIEICGWIGALSYSIYSIPQATSAIHLGRTQGLSSGMVVLLFGGALCSLIYILPDTSSPLFYNFGLSLISATTIFRYHFWPRKK